MPGPSLSYPLVFYTQGSKLSSFCSKTCLMRHKAECTCEGPFCRKSRYLAYLRSDPVLSNTPILPKLTFLAPKIKKPLGVARCAPAGSLSTFPEGLPLQEASVFPWRTQGYFRDLMLPKTRFTVKPPLSNFIFKLTGVLRTVPEN